MYEGRSSSLERAMPHIFIPKEIMLLHLGASSEAMLRTRTAGNPPGHHMDSGQYMPLARPGVNYNAKEVVCLLETYILNRITFFTLFASLQASRVATMTYPVFRASNIANLLPLRSRRLAQAIPSIIQLLLLEVNEHSNCLIIRFCL
jgi:hypothetical protein